MGDYYRGARGDYYQGDPFFGLIARGLGAVAKTALGAVGLKRIAPTIIKVAGGVGAGAAGSALATRALRPPPPGMKPRKGLKGMIQRALPGGETGYFKTRRMNPANPKALRRALRRVSGFAKLAQRAKRDIAKANTAVGNRARGSRGGRGTVLVNPTAARVRTAD